MANYNGILIDSPHRAEDTLRCSATIANMSVDPITFPPTEIHSVIPISKSDWVYIQQDENELAYTGDYVESFLDDYYYRVHIAPATIDFGAIVSPTEEEFIVWNAWFDSKTCTLITKTSPDEYTLDPESYPFSLAQLEWETFTLTADTTGSTEFTATITFTFSGEAPVLTISGTRVAVFPFSPSIPMMETLEWFTNIIRARDGSEQRIAIRPIPRQSFKFNCVLKDEQEQAQLDALLFNWLKRTWGMPVWGEWEVHTNSISADDTIIYLDTTNADFRDDSYAIIWQNHDSYESVKIETVESDRLNLELPVLNNWSGKKWIMPLRIAHMLSPVNWAIDAEGIGRFTCSFLIKDNVLIDTFSADLEYDSIPVLPPSLEDGGLDNNIDGEVVITDYGIDTFTMHSDSDFNIYVQKHVFREDNKADIWALREFLHYLYGRRNPVWICSDKRDFVQTQTLGAAETELTVDAVGWARQMGLNILRTHIAFLFPNGDTYFREITGFTESGSEDIIGLSSTLGIQVEPGDCEICLLDKCRLTEDKVELEWREPFRLICRANFTKVAE